MFQNNEAHPLGTSDLYGDECESYLNCMGVSGIIICMEACVIVIWIAWVWVG